MILVRFVRYPKLLDGDIGLLDADVVKSLLDLELDQERLGPLRLLGSLFEGWHGNHDGSVACIPVHAHDGDNCSLMS